MPHDFTPTTAAPARQPAQQVSADQFIEVLTREGILDQATVISLLGTQRKTGSVNTLELALVRRNVMAAEDVLARKAALWGRPAYPDGKTAVRTDLSQQVAARTGALLLDRDPLTVAMVEPTAVNLRQVAQALGTNEFAVWVTTAPHFTDLLTATYAGARTQEMPPAPDLYTLLDAALERSASDLHLKVGVGPRLRLDGAMSAPLFRAVDRQWMLRAVEAVSPTDRHRAELGAKFSTDLAYSFGTSRFRVNIANDSDGPTMVLRRLPHQLPTSDELGLPASIRALAGLERGLVLVTGPTGSGKSTTLAALLNDIIHTSARHVITLEDPIEFTFPSDRPSLVNQRELGSSFATFPDGIRDALRQDPDVLLVGEMRDLATTRAALEAASTGHLCFATLHTADAPRTVQRIVGLFPADEQDSARVQLAQQLKGCVSQTLVPRASGRGRVAGFEVLLSNPATATNLRKVDGATQLKQTMQTSARAGMTTMEMSLARLARDGVITREEAAFRAQDVEEFERQLQHLSAA